MENSIKDFLFRTTVSENKSMIKNRNINKSNKPNSFNEILGSSKSSLKENKFNNNDNKVLNFKSTNSYQQSFKNNQSKDSTVDSTETNIADNGSNLVEKKSTKPLESTNPNKEDVEKLEVQKLTNEIFNTIDSLIKELDSSISKDDIAAEGKINLENGKSLINDLEKLINLLVELKDNSIDSNSITQKQSILIEIKDNLSKALINPEVNNENEHKEELKDSIKEALFTLSELKNLHKEDSVDLSGKLSSVNLKLNNKESTDEKITEDTANIEEESSSKEIDKISSGNNSLSEKQDSTDVKVFSIQTKEDNTISLGLKQDNYTSIEKVNQTESISEVKTTFIDDNDVMDQIIQKIKIDYKGDESEIRIKLRPESLGEVTLKVTIDKGIVVAKALVENLDIKHLLDSNANILKKALEEHGVDFKGLNVSVGKDSNFQGQHSRAWDDKKVSKQIKNKSGTYKVADDYINLDDINDRSSILYNGSFDIQA